MIYNYKVNIKEYVRTHDVKKLHIGCGKNILKDWLNTDIHILDPNRTCYLDVLEPFPIKDNTFDYVHSEHMLEHFSFNNGLMILKECYRILKPGGAIRITSPNLDMLIDLYQNKEKNLEFIMSNLKPWFNWEVGKDSMSDDHLDQLLNIDTLPIHFLNMYVRMDRHLFIYNDKTLINSVTYVGFKNISRHNICESNDPNLQNLEYIDRYIDDYGIIGREQLQKESMTFEGIK